VDQRDFQETRVLLEAPVNLAFKAQLVSLVQLVSLELQEHKDLEATEEMLEMQDHLVSRELEEKMVHRVKQDSVVILGLLDQPAQPVVLDPREKKGMLAQGVKMVLQEVPVHEVLMDRLVHQARPVPQVTLEMQVHQDQRDQQGLEVTQDRLVMQEVVERQDLLDLLDLVEQLDRQVPLGHLVALAQGEKMDLQERQVSVDQPAHQGRVDLKAVQVQLEVLEHPDLEEFLAHQAKTALQDQRVQQALEDQLVRLDQLVVQGNQDKQDLQDSLVHKVKEEIQEPLDQQDQLDQLVHLAPLDLEETEDQMVLWVPKDLTDQLVQPDHEEIWVNRDWLVKLDHLDQMEIQVHLDQVERLETKE